MSRLEAREGGEGEVRRLAYYGGALGKYLVIQPSGQMRILGERRPPGSQREKEEEEDVGTAEEPNDTVTINQPPENASIAEAKPVAVSIAGVGGVASAQPVATAVVGPGGLAVSRPVATSIAGVEGAEGLLGIIGKNPPPPAQAHSQFYPQPSFYNLIHHHHPPLVYYTLPVYAHPIP